MEHVDRDAALARPLGASTSLGGAAATPRDRCDCCVLVVIDSWWGGGAPRGGRDLPAAVGAAAILLLLIGAGAAGRLAYRSARHFGGTVRAALWRALRTMLHWLTVWAP